MKYSGLYNINVSISSSLKFLKAGKGKQFSILLQTKIWGVLFVLFPAIKYGRLASTETTNLVINASFIGDN